MTSSRCAKPWGRLFQIMCASQKVQTLTKIFLRRNRRPNIWNKTSATKAEVQIVKTFGFCRILQPSVDHCKNKKSSLDQRKNRQWPDFSTKLTDSHDSEFSIKPSVSNPLLICTWYFKFLVWKILVWRTWFLVFFELE